MSSAAAALRSRLSATLLVDARRLEARIRRAHDSRAAPAVWQKLTADVDAAAGRCDLRFAARPVVVYPPDLPVSQRAAEIAEAIRRHQIVIVSGETGSGKTTQLPKICLQAGRGTRGLIGHTQPRRIAARAVAARIAHELGTQVGDAVGFKVRFTDQTSRDAYVKLMTDGILLAETRRDRELLDYDTIIVDEAHERSLNIDFLLGYLKRLCERRSELKLIITSATIDAQRFARHFASGDKNAPVIEVSGRMFPVDVRYRPLGGSDDVGSGNADDEEALEEVIVASVEELWREGPGDILVFLPGEREIRETGELLRRGLARRPYASAVEVLPLYSRLSVQDQQRVFAPSQGRRVVLATNVAETSLTVPGIRYVIDTGLARMKRYNVRNKTTLLAIEKISRAAANQRAGRCGRVQEGIAVRLYSEDDYLARTAYTDPEILRSSLASVILQMAALDLPKVDAFPFLDPPTPRAIADGYQLLQELGAVDTARVLTPAGRELARLPLDPRIGRIVLAARDANCLAEALVIASALAVPDPRERPLDKQAAADQAHLRFRDERSDFLSLIVLWEFFADLASQKLSHRKLVEACRAQFVNYLRMIEWRDVHQQLESELDEAGWKWNRELPKTFDAARYATLHQSLLAGLLGNVGAKASDGDGFEGTRGLRFFLHPASGLAKKPPRWVLAAELVEPTRLFARITARIEPEWIEAVAGERVDRDYFEPHWDNARAEVVASERVQLYGLTLIPRRNVSLGRIDPRLAREVFIAEALVPGALATKGAFLTHNRKLVDEIAELEHKARRQDVLVDAEAIAAFYAERIPAGVYSLVTFERWRVDAESSDPRVLFFTREALMRHAASSVTQALYPETMTMAGIALPLVYRFAPSHPLDGLTLSVPLSMLNQLDDARLSWLVPGMIRDKVREYVKALPKQFRNRLLPLPDIVTTFLADTPPGEAPLTDALRAWIKRRLGESPAANAWDAIDLPPHLMVNVRVVDASGHELGSDRDLTRLRQKLGEAAQMSFAKGAAFEKKGLKRWDFGDLPATISTRRDGSAVTGYPALIDEGDSVSLALLDTAEAAEAATRKGVVGLIRLALPEQAARVAKTPAAFTQASIVLRSAITLDRLSEDVLQAIYDRAFVGDDPLPRNQAAFDEQIKRARTRLPAVADSAFRLLAEIVSRYQALSQRLAALPSAHARFAADIRAQRDQLIHPGFFSATPWSQLAHIPRYLETLERRIAKFVERPDREARHAELLRELARRHAARAERNRLTGRSDPALERFRWLLEELKVSLFAQDLKTPYPVSIKRVEKAWSDLDQ
ncbi:MAG TPA: ATP-dependent RNA helicase HrpA [Casimicrobiaceae bacterium]|nr:ATP-dependent RNA helicase HrpA [Casimicrobiaceae bacterium]